MNLLKNGISKYCGLYRLTEKFSSKDNVFIDFEKISFFVQVFSRDFSVEGSLNEFMNTFSKKELIEILEVDNHRFYDVCNSNFENLTLKELNNFFSSINMKINAVPK